LVHPTQKTILHQILMVLESIYGSKMRFIAKIQEINLNIKKIDPAGWKIINTYSITKTSDGKNKIHLAGKNKK